MKRSSLLFIVFSVLIGPAWAAPFLLVAGSPDPPTLPYVNITNDAAPLYTRGTDFQDVPVGDTLRHKIRLQNVGPDILAYSISDDSSQFRAISPGSVLVGITGEREIEIEFAPTTAGTKTATLTITSNDSLNPTFEINLRGVGTAPECDVFGGPTLDVEISDGDSSPSTADGTNFGSRDIFAGGDSKFFRIENNGTSDLQFVSANITSGQGFSLSSLPAPASTIASGGAHNFIITFDPSSVATTTATVSIITDDSNEGIYTFNVRGTGTVTPDIAVSGQSGGLPKSSIPDGLTVPLSANGTQFANTLVNDSVSNHFRITNEGTAGLDFSLSINSDQFRVSGLDTSTITGGLDGFEEFFIHFEPTSRGVKTATVTIESNDPDEDPYTFLIRGTAVGPEMTLLGDTDFSEEIVNGDDTPRVGDGTNMLDVLVDGGRETRTFRIKNDGDAILTFLAANLSGGNGFFLDDLPKANFPIPAFGYVEFKVGFDPSTDGQSTTTVSIVTTDQDETPYTFDVTANGVGDPNIIVTGNYVGGNLGPGDEIAPGTLVASTGLGTQFGEVDLGELNGNTFLIRNIGNGTLDYDVEISGADFSLSGVDGPLEPNLGSGSQDAFSIIFEPTTRGVKTALVTIASNDPDTPSYVFAVEGTATDPEMDLFGGPIQNVAIASGATSTSTANGTAFPITTVGDGATNTFTIYNDGERDLVIAVGSLDDDEHFTITGLPSAIEPIAPNTGVDFQITFEPQSAGKKSATVSVINSDDDENPYTFRVTGTGVDGPEINVQGGIPLVDIEDGDTTPEVTDGTDFGTQTIGVTVDHEFTVQNLGSEELSISAPTVSAGNGFTLGAPTGTRIRPRGEATFTLSFTPDSVGTKTATVTIRNNDSDEDPYNFVVTGIGAMNTDDPDIEIRNGGGTIVIPSGSTTPSLVNGTDFGVVDVGESLLQTLTVHNTGGTTLSISSSSGASIFSLPSTLSPGASDGFTISLNSATPGLKTAVISIVSDDPDESPYIFTVQGLVLPDEPPTVSSFTLDGTSGVIRFPTYEGVQYRLMASTSMEEGTWNPLGSQPTTGTGELHTLTVFDFGTWGDRYFLRLEVVRP